MKKRTPPRQLVLRTLSQSANNGVLQLGPFKLKCAIGRSGLRSIKREGDGATPIGIFQLESVYYRADRVCRPHTSLPVKRLLHRDGWCDAPEDRNYNRYVRHPYAASAERMWRADRLYDVVVVLSHNRRPRVRGGGSAIFIHVARDDYGPTEGCLAFEKNALMLLLSRAGRRMVIRLGM